MVFINGFFSAQLSCSSSRYYFGILAEGSLGSLIDNRNKYSNFFLTGQIAVKLASEFDKAVELTSIILTRVDGDGRGGAALSMKQTTGKPIKFIGVGEKVDDLQIFDAEKFANAFIETN